jgi:hypothetical protein
MFQRKIFLKELQQNANNNKCAEGSLNLIYFSDEIIYTSSLNYFYKFGIILLIISLIVLLFPHFTTDCEKIVLLTSEFNCSRHLIGQFLFCRDYFLSNCDRSFYKILKDIVGLNTIFM